jgi:bifunctional non-homologous end joining protein LigD
MILWERGWYRTLDGSSPAEGLEKGKLDLVLHGHKLHGRFALVRTRDEDGRGRSWLLLRKGRDAAAVDLVREQPGSVLSGLTVEELAAGVSRSAEVAARARELGAPRGEPDLRALRPMLASTSDAAFSREGWVFELKYDGVRVLAQKQGGKDARVRIHSRSGGDRTDLYPELALALRHLPVENALVDGEVVALDDAGRASFERLQRRFTQTERDAIARVRAEIPVVLYAFDLLFAEGHDLRGLPLGARKELLALFAPRQGFVRFADHVTGDGRALFEGAREHGFEGILAKQADSRYEAGARSRSWLKIKVPRTADLVVVGYQGRKGSARDVGSLLLGWHRGGELVYAGKVGSGLAGRVVEALLPELEARSVDEPVVANLPEEAARVSVHVRPELVCEVRYTEITQSGSLRHPVFLRLRDDKDPSECQAPADPEALAARQSQAETRASESAAPESARPELTRLDKVFWPIEGYTKGDLLAYYESVWPWLAPYLADRPVVLVRYPDGIAGKHFYQKNAPEFTPEWVRREQIDGTDYFLCDDLRTLLYVVNSGAIPLHVWSARRASIERPDWLILDLDPKEAPFSQVVEVARHVHRLLASLGAPHFLKSSGQAGLHVLLPLGAGLDHAEARALAEVLARVVCAERPELATIARPLAARGRKVYVDYLQNGRGKLIAAPLCVRPRPHAPVSMPLRWAQLTARLDPERFTIATAPAQLRRHGDPMRGVLEESVDVEVLLAALAERLARLDAG